MNCSPVKDTQAMLCLKFAKACLKNDNVKNMFPYNDQIDQDIRQDVTGRMKDSTIPYMKRLLNDNQ